MYHVLHTIYQITFLVSLGLDSLELHQLLRPRHVRGLAESLSSQAKRIHG